MPQVLSNLGVYCPFYSMRTSKTYNPVGGDFPQFVFKDGRDFGFSDRRSINAMAAKSRENLDHLQRPIKHQQSQPTEPRRRPAPIGLWDRFPTARTVQQMMETMEKMIEDPFEYSGGWPLPLSSEGGG